MEKAKGWINAVGAVALMAALTVFSQAQETTIDGYPIGQLPNGTGGEGQPYNCGMAGPFVDIHNDALIIAGGANFPIPNGHRLCDKGANGNSKLHHSPHDSSNLRLVLATRPTNLGFISVY